jgi:hypothetical protein
VLAFSAIRIDNDEGARKAAAQALNNLQRMGHREERESE